MGILSLSWLKWGAVAFLVAGLTYGIYNAGANSVRAEYNKAIIRMAEHYKVAQDSLDDYTAKYLAEKAKKQQIKTITVEKAKREIIKLPVRDCGWTPDEWVQLNNAYCAAFPDVPDCLHAGLSRSAPDVSPAGRPMPKTPGDPVDDRSGDLSGRETSMSGTSGETP